MLKFNSNIIYTDVNGIANLNTSYVKVQWKYIQILEEAYFYLNTSYVKVQQIGQIDGLMYINHLNTSYVKVQ